MCSKLIDETGNVYGDLVVLHRAQAQHTGSNVYWSCKCKCGRIKDIQGTRLRTNCLTDCGCSRTIDETGNRYGKLMVVKRHYENKGHHLAWLCICDCGNETVVDGVYLRSGHTKSCGCLRYEWKPPFTLSEGEASFNNLYANYKRNAKVRHLSFALSKAEVRKFTKQNCHYCGQPPEQEHGRASKNNGVYVYNGLDRIDNDSGYVQGNVVPCCKQCNMAKNNMPYSEFMCWIARLVAHQESRREVTQPSVCN